MSIATIEGAKEGLTTLRFSRFQQLPDHVRARIWSITASVPRVVEVHECHGSTYSSPARTVRHETRMRSCTRPPAILSVNHESRTQALSIYTSIYSELNSPDHYLRPVPIYVNPAVDITYRGKNSCKRGDSFKIYYKNYGVDCEPLAATPTLAVDIIALRPRRPMKAPVFDYDGWDSMLGQWRPWIGQFEHYPMSQAAEEIMACAEKGLKEVILVVGNEDDLSDITLVPAKPFSQSPSDAFYQAERNAQALRAALTLKSPAPPTVKIMTPKRLPLQSFSFFPKLPQEIQNMIWHHASIVPRVISIEHTGGLGCDECQIKNVRAPSLLHVCRASRTIQQAQYTRPIDLRGEDRLYRYYNHALDTVHLPMYGINPAKLAGYRSVAVSNSYSSCDRFTGKEAKALRCEEIVILAEKGALKRTRRCELELEPVKKPAQRDYDATYFAKTSLEWSMGKRSESWKKYQAKRRAKGLVTLDWVMPEVKVARLKAVTQIVSPYDY